MNGGALSDARIFDVAKGVLIAVHGCSVDEALAELASVADCHRVGVLALARALVALAFHRIPRSAPMMPPPKPPFARSVICWLVNATVSWDRRRCRPSNGLLARGASGPGRSPMVWVAS